MGKERQFGGFVSGLLAKLGKMNVQMVGKVFGFTLQTAAALSALGFGCFPLQEELYLKHVEELDNISSERDRFREAFEELRKQRLNEFMAGFNVITNKLKENYQMLTLGGDAELELVDSLDPFSEGIMFRFLKYFIFH